MQSAAPILGRRRRSDRGEPDIAWSAPVGRMGAIEEIVEAVLYLETAGFVTGETLHVDGGAHAGRW